MLILATYDVNTTTPEGRKRLRQIATACLNYGQRVQFSVFECLVGPEQLVLLRRDLLRILNPREDSLRIYMLDEAARQRIEHYGTKPPIDFEEPLIV